MIFPRWSSLNACETQKYRMSWVPNLSDLVLPSRMALMILRHLYQCTTEKRITAVHYLKIWMRIFQLMSSVLYLSDKTGNKVRNRVIKKDNVKDMLLALTRLLEASN